VRQALPFRQNPRFLVEEAEAEELSSKESKKVVGVDLGIARLATLSDGRFLENPKPLERSLERVRVLQSLKKGFFSKNWLKARMKLAKEHEHLKDFRRDSLNLGRYLQGSTTS
jgi:putative transposase